MKNELLLKHAAANNLILYRGVTFYTTTLFGIERTDCKELTIQPGKKYAQYDNAIDLTYLPVGKNKARVRMLYGNDVYLMVCFTKDAIVPESEWVNVGGATETHYPSADTRYLSDFIKHAFAILPLYLVQRGKIEIDERSRGNGAAKSVRSFL